MSNWINLASGLNCGASPYESIQFNLAPIKITTSAFFNDNERAAAECLSSSGTRPLAIDIGKNGISVLLINS